MTRLSLNVSMHVAVRKAGPASTTDVESLNLIKSNVFRDTFLPQVHHTYTGVSTHDREVRSLRSQSRLRRISTFSTYCPDHEQEKTLCRRAFCSCELHQGSQGHIDRRCQKVKVIPRCTKD